ncbi:hypothetical protein AB6A40_009727 [Gnathostoma spinigerum]|uniref:Uncharacterized protein n=1 Tax=Gnathostoma spinigerum TaxID=75299 RepID=A0ABD6EST1_9BILA
MQFYTLFQLMRSIGPPTESSGKGFAEVSTGSAFGLTTISPVGTETDIERGDPSDNLIGSLLNGRFGEIDWLGSFLGTKQNPTGEEGNAFAQIFRGGIFGSADDLNVI